jgi:hypothetical protein
MINKVYETLLILFCKINKMDKGKMKKTPGKKRRSTSYKNQKQRAFQSLMILGIILTLSIVILLLLPKTIIVGDPGEQTGNEKTPVPDDAGRDTRVREEPDKTPGTTPLPGNPREVQTTHEGKIAVVIDDAGNNIGDLLPFLQFPYPLTIAVLPQLPHSREAAELSIEAGKEVILHLPMEAEGTIHPGPGTLYERDSREKIIQTMNKNFASVPGATGVNNHMGSKLTPVAPGTEAKFLFMVWMIFSRESLS